LAPTKSLLSYLIPTEGFVLNKDEYLVWYAKYIEWKKRNPNRDDFDIHVYLLADDRSQLTFALIDSETDKNASLDQRFLTISTKTFSVTNAPFPIPAITNREALARIDRWINHKVAWISASMITDPTNFFKAFKVPYTDLLKLKDSEIYVFFALKEEYDPKENKVIQVPELILCTLENGISSSNGIAAATDLSKPVPPFCPNGGFQLFEGATGQTVSC